MGDTYTGYDYGSCALPFLKLPSIYKPRFCTFQDMARTGNNYENGYGEITK